MFPVPADRIRRLTYSFIDSSVPPAYHRSYDIVVTSGKVKVTVDSYGDVLAEKEHDLAPGRFEALLRSLEQRGIRKIPLTLEPPGYTGGTSERVVCSDGREELFEATLDHCGGSDFGDLGGDVRGFADEVKALVPELPDLLA